MASIASATMPAVGELRQPTGTAFTIRDPLPWHDVAAIARAGEASTAHYDRSHVLFYEKHLPTWAPLLRLWFYP